MISARCECGKEFNVPKQYAGKRARCRFCGAVFTVGESPAAQPVADPGHTAVRPEIPIAQPIRARVLPREPAADTAACYYCGESILAVARKCKHCGELLDPALRTSLPPVITTTVSPTIVNHVTTVVGRGGRRWSRVVAALLSLLIPGLGQVYKGQPLNGLVWLLFTVAGYAAFIVPGVVLHILCILGAASGDNG